MAEIHETQKGFHFNLLISIDLVFVVNLSYAHLVM